MFKKMSKKMSLISNFMLKYDFLNKYFAGFDKSWEHLFLQCCHPGEIIVKGKILAQLEIVVAFPMFGLYCFLICYS